MISLLQLLSKRIMIESRYILNSKSVYPLKVENIDGLC